MGLLLINSTKGQKLVRCPEIKFRLQCYIHPEIALSGHTCTREMTVPKEVLLAHKCMKIQLLHVVPTGKLFEVKTDKQ
jgi:hypothetical protein